MAQGSFIPQSPAATRGAIKALARGWQGHVDRQEEHAAEVMREAQMETGAAAAEHNAAGELFVMVAAE